MHIHHARAVGVFHAAICIAWLVDCPGLPPLATQSRFYGADACGLTVTCCLGQYLLSSGSEGLSGVGFVYGIPILLIGLALKYAQLDPVPVEVSQLSTPPMDFNMRLCWHIHEWSM